jgi:hypothetical protein
MPTCHDLQLNQVYTCPDCGLEVTVTRECRDARQHDQHSDCCNPGSDKECVLVCCGRPLQKK